MGDDKFIINKDKLAANIADVRHDIEKEQAEQRKAAKPDPIVRPKKRKTPFPTDAVLFSILPVVTCLVTIIAWAGISGVTMDSLSLSYKDALLGDSYRFITYMFVHASKTHLINNLLSYIIIGALVYRYLNRRDFFLVYFFSGIVGGFVSASINVEMTPNGSTVGCSAAIYGLLGTYISILLSKRGNIWYSICVMIAAWITLSVSHGGVDGVDWAAHFGGVITGLMLGDSMADRKGIRYTKKAARMDNKKNTINIKKPVNVLSMEEWKKKNHWQERKKL